YTVADKIRHSSATDLYDKLGIVKVFFANPSKCAILSIVDAQIISQASNEFLWTAQLAHTIIISFGRVLRIVS
ncbi:MAG: hypothetical protein ACREAS_01100, partial [Nitrososphaera sp.]